MMPTVADYRTSNLLILRVPATARVPVTAEVASSSLVVPAISSANTIGVPNAGARRSARLSSVSLNYNRPRVDYRNRKILKMRCVSCCELRVRSKHDAGDHCVAQFAWTSLLMTHSHQIP